MVQEQPGRYDFEMTVMDVFVFEDGRTVFTGEVTSGPNYIPPCDCELVVGKARKARFKIEGEMIPLNKTAKNLRAISTTEKIDVALIHRFKGQCSVRSI